jgi:hypothetical protein
MNEFTPLGDERLDEIGLHLRAASARRISRSRRRLASAIGMATAGSIVLLAAGALTRGGSEDALAAEVVKQTEAAATDVPAGGRTILHVVTQLGRGPGGTMEVWEAGDRYRRVGYHTDGSIHAEETLRPLASGEYEYRAFHREPGGDVIRVARTSDPNAFDIDLVDPASDLRAAVEAGKLQFVGEASFEGTPAYELLLELEHPCGVILPDARIFVERDTYRPIAVRLGPEVLRFVTIEEVPFDTSLLEMGKHPGTRVVNGMEAATPRSPAC